MAMEVLKLFNIKSPILLLKTLSDGNLAIVDSLTTVRIIDKKNYGVVGGFKSNVTLSRLTGSHVDVSKDGVYTLVSLPQGKNAALFNIPEKALVSKLGRHQGEVESVGIDPNDRYGVTCGQDGKVFGWVLSTSRLAFTMPPHADFVSTVAFNENGQWIATGSYDRTIHVLNTATMKKPSVLKGHTSVVVKIAFLPEARLVSVEKEGSVLVWDLRTGRVLNRLPKMNDDVTTMTISSDKRFIFVGTKLGYVGLYDLDKDEQVRHRYLKESEPISSLAFLTSPVRLAVGTSEGNVKIYSLTGNEEELVGLIRSRQFKAYYEKVEENPFLLYSRTYELAEKKWQDSVEEARKLLEKSDKIRAKELLEPFGNIPKKGTFANQLISAYDKYSQFMTYIREGRFSLAYTMSKQYPPFQDSEPYRQMEAHWRKLFAKARELAQTPNGTEQAKQLLAPFRGVSEKTVLIQQLFDQYKMYEYMKKLIAQHDFVKLFALVKMHPFLKEFKEFLAVVEYGDKLYIQAHKSYMEGDYLKAKRACEILSAFPDYAKEAEELNETIRVKHLFYDAITSDNLENAFSYLSSYPLLYDTPEAQVLERQWNLLVDQAQQFAAGGDAAKAFSVFAPYKSIRDKYAAMAAVIAQAYCVQLEQKIRTSASLDVVTRGVRQYIALFGLDEGISAIVNYLNLKQNAKIDPQIYKQGSYENWTPASMMDEITAV